MLSLQLFVAPGKHANGTKRPLQGEADSAGAANGHGRYCLHALGHLVELATDWEGDQQPWGWCR